jgi:tetratricopeptide (TPR) repeat protein
MKDKKAIFKTLIEVTIILCLVLIAVSKRYFEFIWWKFFIVYIVCAIGCLLGLYMVIFKKWDFTFRYRILLPFSLLTFFALLSFIWAYNWYKGFRLVMTFSAGVVPFLLILLFYNPENSSLRRILFAISITSGFTGFYGIVQYHHLCEVLNKWAFDLIGIIPIKNPSIHPVCILPADQYGQLSPISTFGLSNFAAEYTIMTLPAGFILLITEKRWMRLISAIPFLLALYYLIISKNRGGYMGFLFLFTFGIGFMVLKFIKDKKVPFLSIAKYLVPSLAIFALFLAFHPSGKGAVSKFLTSFDLNHPTVQTRLHAWKSALYMIKDHPLLGVGIANYEIYSWKYQTEKLERMTLATNTRVDKTHNEYLQVLSELGIIGFGLFVWLLFEIGRSILNGISKGENIFYALSFGMGIIAILVDSLFAFPLQFPATVVHFWIYAGIITKMDPFNQPIKATERVYAFFEKWKNFVAITLLFLSFICMVIFSYLSYNMVSAEWHYRAGQFLKLIPKMRAALKEYNLAQKAEPFNERTYYDRAFVKWKLGDFDGAIKDLKKCLDYVPYFGKARKEYATMLYQVGRQEEALQEFFKAAENHYVARHFIYSYIAIIYMNQGNMRNALDYAREAEKYLPENPAPDDAQAFFNIGTVYLNVGDLETGKKFLERAIEINPNETSALVNLGAYYLKTGDFKNALYYLEKAKEMGNESPHLFYNLGVAYFKTGKKDLAEEFLRKAVSMRPEFMDRINQDAELKKLLEKGR